MSRTPIKSQGAEDLPPAVADQLLDAVRAELDHEFQVAERIDGKTQRFTAFAGATFALVQAAAISNLLRQLERTDRHVLIFLALGALVGLAAAGVAMLGQEKLLKVGELPLREMNNLVAATYGPKAERSGRQSTEILRELTTIYTGMLLSRRKANSKRIARYKWSRWAAGVSVCLTIVELGWALGARLS